MPHVVMTGIAARRFTGGQKAVPVEAHTHPPPIPHPPPPPPPPPPPHQQGPGPRDAALAPGGDPRRPAPPARRRPRRRPLRPPPRPPPGGREHSGPGGTRRKRTHNRRGRCIRHSSAPSRRSRCRRPTRRRSQVS